MANPSHENSRLYLVDALTKAQLFGTDKQIDMARISLQSIAAPQGYVLGLGDLLSSLRNSFRKDLDLCIVDENVATVRRIPKNIIAG